MTEKEYNQFWAHEKKVEQIIKSGKFGEMIKGQDVDRLLREANGENIIKGIKQKWPLWKVCALAFIVINVVGLLLVALKII